MQFEKKESARSTNGDGEFCRNDAREDEFVDVWVLCGGETFKEELELEAGCTNE